MWDLETLKRIDQMAVRMAQEGKIGKPLFVATRILDPDRPNLLVENPREEVEKEAA